MFFLKPSDVRVKNHAQICKQIKTEDIKTDHCFDLFKFVRETINKHQMVILLKELIVWDRFACWGRIAIIPDAMEQGPAPSEQMDTRTENSTILRSALNRCVPELCCSVSGGGGTSVLSCLGGTPTWDCGTSPGTGVSPTCD